MTEITGLIRLVPRQPQDRAMQELKAVFRKVESKEYL